MRQPFLTTPGVHCVAQRASYDRVRDGYAGTYYKRPSTWGDRLARGFACLLVLAALGLLIGGA